jgi:hypothetical protein
MAFADSACKVILRVNAKPFATACKATNQRVHRVATATSWRTFHHDGNLAQAGECVGGARPPPFKSSYHHVLNVRSS